MNTFGRIFRISIFGESHGSGVGVVIDGCPAGIPIKEEDFSKDMGRRRSGAKGTTARKESDIPKIKSGVFRGRTTGAPIMLFIGNENIDSSDYEKTKDMPRPGHADLVAREKYGQFNDYRGGGHFSGRLTAPLVAAGVLAKKIIDPVDITAELTRAGGSEDIDGKVHAALEEQDSIGGIVDCIYLARLSEKPFLNMYP